MIQVVDTNISFGGRTIVSRGVAVVRDRLGSNRAGGVKYYPYGEEQAGRANDKDKYGTYYRDADDGAGLCAESVLCEYDGEVFDSGPVSAKC